MVSLFGRRLIGSRGLLISGMICSITIATSFVLYRTWIDNMQTYPSNQLRTLDGVAITAYVNNVDFTENKYYVTISTAVYGSYAAKALNTAIPSRNLTLNYGSAVQSFSANSSLYNFVLSPNFDDGDFTRFPFDTWKSRVVFIVEDRVPIPINFTLVDSTPSHYMDCRITVDGNNIILDWKISRTWSTIISSLTMVTVAWLITFAYIAITYKIVVRRRQSPMEVAGLGSFLIFAMTSLRSMQPGVPFTECLTDIMGFYWCILLQSNCVILAMIHWINHHDDESMEIRMAMAI